MTKDNHAAEMPTLLPCPFCGDMPTLKRVEGSTIYGVVCQSEVCQDSGLIIALADRGAGLDKPINAWNTRANSLDLDLIERALKRSIDFLNTDAANIKEFDASVDLFEHYQIIHKQEEALREIERAKGVK